MDQVTIERTEPVEELTNEELETMTEYEVPIQISFNTLAGQIQYENTLQLTRPLNEKEEEEENEEDRWFVNGIQLSSCLKCRQKMRCDIKQHWHHGERF